MIIVVSESETSDYLVYKQGISFKFQLNMRIYVSLCWEILAEVNQRYQCRIQYFAHEVTKDFIILHTYIYIKSNYVLHVNIRTFLLQLAHVGTLKVFSRLVSQKLC